MPEALPLLSLCLPTYNRAPLLAQALRAVLEQIPPPEAAHLEVLVLDNASPDNTAEVVAQAGQEWPQAPLRSVRHPENLGMDGNFLEAICQARGQFVCLLSDDDILLPGAVEKLLALIRQHPDFDAFCLNARSFHDSPAESGPPWIKISEDRTLHDRDEALRLIKDSIGYLSILAFNKSRIADKLAGGQYRDKVGTYFLESYVFLDVLACGQGAVVIAQPMIAQHVENAHASNYFRVFITELSAVLDYAEKIGFSREVVRWIKASNLVEARHFVSRVKIYGRELGVWSSRPDAIRRLFRVYGFSPYLWLVVVPLMFFPSPLRPLVFRVRRMLGRPDVPQDANA